MLTVSFMATSSMNSIRITLRRLKLQMASLRRNHPAVVMRWYLRYPPEPPQQGDDAGTGTHGRTIQRYIDQVQNLCTGTKRKRCRAHLKRLCCKNGRLIVPLKNLLPGIHLPNFKWRHYQSSSMHYVGILVIPFQRRQVASAVNEGLDNIHTAMSRWVQRYSLEIDLRCRLHLLL